MKQIVTALIALVGSVNAGHSQTPYVNCTTAGTWSYALHGANAAEIQVQSRDDNWYLCTATCEYEGVGNTRHRVQCTGVAIPERNLETNEFNWTTFCVEPASGPGEGYFNSRARNISCTVVQNPNEQ